METDPRVEERPSQSYAGIRGEAKNEQEFGDAVDSTFPAVFDWLGRKGIAPAGPPFIRTEEVGEGGVPRRFEVGVPVSVPFDGDEEVERRELPAGRYATLLHRGPYTHDEVRDLDDARHELLAWARDENIEVASAASPPGRSCEICVDRFLVDASSEPDWTKWETELSYLLA